MPYLSCRIGTTAGALIRGNRTGVQGAQDITAEILAEKVISGGGGNWGVVPMVANEHVKKNEALTMANWILEFTP